MTRKIVQELPGILPIHGDLIIHGHLKAEM